MCLFSSKTTPPLSLLILLNSPSHDGWLRIFQKHLRGGKSSGLGSLAPAVERVHIGIGRFSATRRRDKTSAGQHVNPTLRNAVFVPRLYDAAPPLASLHRAASPKPIQRLTRQLNDRRISRSRTSKARLSASSIRTSANAPPFSIIFCSLSIKSSLDVPAVAVWRLRSRLPSNDVSITA